MRAHIEIKVLISLSLWCARWLYIREFSIYPWNWKKVNSREKSSVALADWKSVYIRIYIWRCRGRVARERENVLFLLDTILLLWRGRASWKLKKAARGHLTPTGLTFFLIAIIIIIIIIYFPLAILLSLHVETEIRKEEKKNVCVRRSVLTLIFSCARMWTLVEEKCKIHGGWRRKPERERVL